MTSLSVQIPWSLLELDQLSEDALLLQTTTITIMKSDA